MKDFFSPKRLAKMGILAALAFVLYLINIPMPFLFPAFLEINLSDFPALIGGFSMGPISGSIIVLVKILIKLPFTSTVGVGELSDLVNGLALVIPSSIIYKYHKTKKGALIGLLIGSLASIVTAVFCNLFIMIPLYLNRMGLQLGQIVAMCPPMFKVTEENFYTYYTFLAVIPFNLLRCLLAGTVTFFVYKRLTGLMNKLD